MAIKLIAGRFRGKAEKSSKKLLWSGLVSIGPILAMLTFFVLSLFSLYWFVGDIYNKTGDLEKAEVYYVKALNEYPESMDILYEMGKLYRQREQWETAFDYLKRAYESDPTYWGPRAVVLAPDTLMKMGKYNEALELCKEILKNHPNKIDIKRAITRKQDYIVKERQIHEM
jgi:tetratricopeptide (TPR) repeat protein